MGKKYLIKVIRNVIGLSIKSIVTPRQVIQRLIKLTLDLEYECPKPSCACSRFPEANTLINLVKWARMALVSSLIVSSDRQGILRFS
jgi:hypothetical protein